MNITTLSSSSLLCDMAEDPVIFVELHRESDIEPFTFSITGSACGTDESVEVIASVIHQLEEWQGEVLRLISVKRPERKRILQSVAFHAKTDRTAGVQMLLHVQAQPNPVQIGFIGAYLNERRNAIFNLL